jgi:hypothetical protein
MVANSALETSKEIVSGDYFSRAVGLARFHALKSNNRFYAPVSNNALNKSLSK